MKALVFHDVGDIRLEDVPDPEIREPSDALVRITGSAICGTDLHMVRGTMPGMEEGTVLGHEAVGVVEEVGDSVRNLRPGDRVVVPSTIACGTCSYCRAGYFAQCDNANPNGPRAGTAFFGGPASTGGFDGLQAEMARIPFAATGLVKIPDGVDDDEALLLSDIFPTGYFGAELAEVGSGDTVVVLGCGPVGQFAVASAFLLGAGRVLAVDRVESRLEMAREQGAEPIHFEREDPVETVLELTGGIGVDRAIDAVGVDAEPPRHGPAAEEDGAGDGDGGPGDRQLWRPGAAPTKAVEWSVDMLAKAGSLGIIGVYPETVEQFPLGKAMNRNLTIHMGNCHHRAYIPHLMNLVETGSVHPAKLLTREESLHDAVEAYESFDRREQGWLKVKLEPRASSGRAAEGRETEGRAQERPEPAASRSS